MSAVFPSFRAELFFVSTNTVLPVLEFCVLPGTVTTAVYVLVIIKACVLELL